MGGVGWERMGGMRCGWEVVVEDLTIAITIGLSRPIAFHVDTAALSGKSMELELSSSITEYLLSNDLLDDLEEGKMFQ